MTVEQDKLRVALDRLQTQVDELRLREPAMAESLQATLAEAREVITARSAEVTQHNSVVKRLSAAVLKYEASHPALSGALGRIVDALADIGIERRDI